METWYRFNKRDLMQWHDCRVEECQFHRSTDKYLITETSHGDVRTAKTTDYREYYPSLEEARYRMKQLLVKKRHTCLNQIDQKKQEVEKLSALLNEMDTINLRG